MPKEGIAKACSTSAAVTWRRTTLFTGTTISLSAARRRGCPGFSSFSRNHVRVEPEAALVGRDTRSPSTRLWPVVFTTTSCGGMMSCSRRTRNEGIAMATRISTGTIVQATSRTVLCVVCAGTGLARSLKRTTMIDEERQHEQRDDGDDPDKQPVVEEGDVCGRPRSPCPGCRSASLRRCRQERPWRRRCRAPWRPERAPPPIENQPSRSASVLRSSCCLVGLETARVTTSGDVEGVQ